MENLGADNAKLYGIVREYAQDLTRKQLPDAIHKLDIGHTGKLIDSLRYSIGKRDGAPTNVTTTLEYYGLFVMMGVGKGVPLPLVSSSNRSPKDFYGMAVDEGIDELADKLATEQADIILKRFTFKFD